MHLLRHGIIHHNGNHCSAFRLLFRHPERKGVMLLRLHFFIRARQCLIDFPVIVGEGKTPFERTCHGKIPVPVHCSVKIAENEFRHPVADCQDISLKIILDFLRKFRRHLDCIEDQCHVECLRNPVLYDKCLGIRIERRIECCSRAFRQGLSAGRHSRIMSGLQFQRLQNGSAILYHLHRLIAAAPIYCQGNRGRLSSRLHGDITADCVKFYVLRIPVKPNIDIHIAISLRLDCLCA